MKNDPQEPLHLGWLADAGAREAIEEGLIEPFGHRIKEREKAPQADKYDLLLKGLYDAAKAGNHFGSFSFDMFLSHVQCEFPDAAHQIRAGLRDSEKAGKRSERTRSPFHLGSIGNSAGGLLSGTAFEREWFAPANPTTQAGFTEEEIDAVESWCWELGFSLSDFAKYQKTHIRIMPSTKPLSRPISPERVAAIAEHLAKQEG